jgi:hypothetical protein
MSESVGKTHGFIPACVVGEGDTRGRYSFRGGVLGADARGILSEIEMYYAMQCKGTP